MEPNEVLDKLPRHLLSLVIEQPYTDYTAQDHAIWRYVMRQNVKYLSEVAHHSYVDGLRRTGISIDSIPHMYGMNRILKDIGWAAVAVDGFIPPAAFMEFQAYNVLVIAADIRPIDQVEYTPAPDIIHEAAGHAPIIADPEYAEYLVRFGKYGCKAFSSRQDYRLYEAIRHLSIIKADPYSTPEEIKNAENELSFLEKNMGGPSEMALIRNLHWWTVEYGLIGDLKAPKIYGAGLLSSIGESYSALNNGVRKLPYSLEAMNVGFDITTKQPQLFVTPDFRYLTEVLEAFADRMALRSGGLEGVYKAIDSGATATCEYSSGLQVSGTFDSVIESSGQAIYLHTTGPTTLSFKNLVLPGQGLDYHKHGFGSPVGKLEQISTPLEEMSETELNGLGITIGNEVRLDFESGVQVSGRVEDILQIEGRNLVITFHNCKVSYQNKDLFLPDWGPYDMACGEKIVSAFNGPADPVGFGLSFPVPSEKTHKIEHSPEARKLHALYQEIRDIREKKSGYERIPAIWEDLKTKYPADWLLSLEIRELLMQKALFPSTASEVADHLIQLKSTHPESRKLIEDGME